MTHEILLAEDSKTQIKLMQLALLEAGIDHNLHVVEDGEQAIAFLRRQEPHTDAVRPDLALLDLNMPRMNGHQVLDEIKADDELRSIPVVILTTSNYPADVIASYDKYANSHIVKPMGFQELVDHVIKGINDYWFNVVEMPPS